MGDKPWPASSSGSICSRIARHRSNQPANEATDPIRDLMEGYALIAARGIKDFSCVLYTNSVPSRPQTAAALIQ